MALAALPAEAADFPDLPILRGALPVSTPRTLAVWEGSYVGAHYGVNSGTYDFSGTSRELAQQMLQYRLINQMAVGEWKIFGNVSRQTRAMGFFAGYNSQWDQAVIGIDVNYNAGSNDSAIGAVVTPMGRRMVIGANEYAVNANGASTARLRDYGTLRLRGGYAMDSVMPYGTVGLAVGRADYLRSVTITEQSRPVDPPNSAWSAPYDDVRSEGKQNAFVYGYSFGLGVDALLAGSIFARAEWEYIKFTGPVEMSINTARVGLGMKF